MPGETAEESGVFGQAAQLSLNNGKSVLERGELLEELLLRELLFPDTAFSFVLNVTKTFHDDAPWSCGSDWVTPHRLDVHSTTSVGFNVTGLDML